MQITPHKTKPWLCNVHTHSSIGQELLKFPGVRNNRTGGWTVPRDCLPLLGVSFTTPSTLTDESRLDDRLYPFQRIDANCGS